jgi:hypothetical protein
VISKVLLSAPAGRSATTNAVLLGPPDGIWATGTHLAFICATAIVAAAAAAEAAMIERVGRRRGTERLC